MKTFKIGENEMEEREITFDFRHLKTVDHGNGMVTEITGCFMKCGTLLRFCDCIADENKNVHVVSVNYHLEPTMTAGQLEGDPSAKIVALDNSARPYLEHEVESGEIEFGEENTPMDTAEIQAMQGETLVEDIQESNEPEEETELEISDKDREKLAALLNSVDDEEEDEPEILEEDDGVVETEVGIVSEPEEIEIKKPEPTPAPPEVEKPRKHHLNNPTPPSNNNFKKNKKHNKHEAERRVIHSNVVDESDLNSALLNAINGGWN